MKLTIKDKNNENKGNIELPEQFSEEIRPDIISRAFLAMRTEERQPYGSFPRAGKRASARLSKRRRDYRTCYGFGISRTPRKIMSRRGTRMNWVGAFSPNTVGGRKAHPPKANRNWVEQINKKENRKAIRSAIAATLSKELVLQRGHVAPKDYPFIIDDGFEAIQKTKEVVTAFQKLGLKEELKRCSEKNVRAGKGKLRGRKYRRKTGPLIVVSNNSSIIKSGINVPGVDVVNVTSLNAKLLAPGGDVARLTLFTKGAVERMKKESLFTNHIKHAKSE
ncbi:50S ribosomal protein L4 [Candidatus Woesearchaeota archaeon]|nr:50S ribosomal protein L4 [Candidatus Woesearchaeota archaeon]